MCKVNCYIFGIHAISEFGERFIREFYKCFRMYTCTNVVQLMV